jgi:hypothetical protein
MVEQQRGALIRTTYLEREVWRQTDDTSSDGASG